MPYRYGPTGTGGSGGGSGGGVFAATTLQQQGDATKGIEIGLTVPDSGADWTFRTRRKAYVAASVNIYFDQQQQTRGLRVSFDQSATSAIQGEEGNQFRIVPVEGSHNQAVLDRTAHTVTLTFHPTTAFTTANIKQALDAIPELDTAYIGGEDGSHSLVFITEDNLVPDGQFSGGLNNVLQLVTDAETKTATLYYNGQGSPGTADTIAAIAAAINAGPGASATIIALTSETASAPDPGATGTEKAFQGRLGASGRDGADADAAAIDDRIEPASRRYNPSGQYNTGRIPAEIARDSEITTAITNLKGGVAAAYDTLAELAAERVAGLRYDNNGQLTITKGDGSTEQVTITGFKSNDQINALITAALQAAVAGNTESGIEVVYNADGTLDFIVNYNPSRIYEILESNVTHEVVNRNHVVTLTVPFTSSEYTQGLTLRWISKATNTQSALRTRLRYSDGTLSPITIIRHHDSEFAVQINELGANYVVTMSLVVTGSQPANTWWDSDIPTAESPQRPVEFLTVDDSSDSWTASYNGLENGAVPDLTRIGFRASRPNGGPVTLNVSSIGPEDVLRTDGSALTAADISTGQTIILVYSFDDETWRSNVPPPGGTTIAEALAAILAGTGVTIDRSTTGQITIAATDTGSNVPDGPTAAGKYELERTGNGVLRWVSASSGQPVVHPTLLFGTSADAVPEASELTITGAMGAGTVPAYQGSRHLLVARLASEPDIAAILFSDDSTRTNQVGAFTKYGQSVTAGGAAYSVWVSNQALTQAASLTITVS